jgi:hypothetical protein
MADLSDAQWDYVRLLVEWQQRSRRDGRGGRWGDAPPLEGGAVIRMDAQLPPPRHAMGVSRNQLPRHGSTRLHVNAIETSVRYLLVKNKKAPKGETIPRG